MIIIEENELYQTDSFEDILQHHGVKGMKWGQRMKRWGSAYGGMVKRLKKDGMVTKRQAKGYRLQFKAMRKHMSATKDRAVLSEMYDLVSKSRGRAMTFNTNKAGRLSLVSNAKDNRAEQLRKKASQYMN